MTLFRKALLTVFLVSLTGSAFGAGTFATFSASTTNAGATFATGTIVLENSNNGVGSCFSTGPDQIIEAGDGTTDDADNAFQCTGTFFEVDLRAPGDTATVDLDLTNAGTLDASALEVYRSDACVSSSFGTPGPGVFTGSGDMCLNTLLTIQEWDDAGRTDIGDCIYGGNTGATEAACTTDAGANLSAFSTAHQAAGAGAVLASGIPAGETAHLRITFEVPLTAPNSLQGREATFGFTWRIDQ